jgi:DnaD/phage-associated family protein
MPIGEIWQGGTFCIPTKIVSDYIKLASEYQLKALMLILADNGKSESRDIAKALGCTESDADDFLDFWVEEGVLIKDGQSVTAPTKTVDPEPEKKAEEPKKVVSAMPVPTLSPKDIVTLCRDSAELTAVLRNAQEVLGKTLSHAEQEMIINMITYYGLPGDVVLVILQYYKTEKAKGKAIGTAYIAAMARNWSEDGITTLEAADERLRELEASDRLWNEIVALTGIRHRNPTVNQREMIKRWSSEFSIEMISLACDAMKENADKPTLKYVDGVLKNWKKKGISTPQDVETENANHRAKNDSKNATKLKSKPSFDLNKIAQDTLMDDKIYF